MFGYFLYRYIVLYMVYYSYEVNNKQEVNIMKIIKIDANGKEYNYGKGYKDAYEVIPKNYKFNGLFYEASNTKTIYIVEEED